MERARRVGQLRRTGAAALRLQDRAELLDEGLVAVAGRPRRHRRFDDQPQVEHLAHLVDAQRADDVSASGKGDDEPLDDEDLQGLPHRRLRHPEARGQLGLDDDLARGEPGADDVVPERHVHLLRARKDPIPVAESRGTAPTVDGMRVQGRAGFAGRRVHALSLGAPNRPPAAAERSRRSGRIGPVRQLQRKNLAPRAAGRGSFVLFLWT